MERTECLDSRVPPVNLASQEHEEIRVREESRVNRSPVYRELQDWLVHQDHPDISPMRRAWTSQGLKASRVSRERLGQKVRWERWVTLVLLVPPVVLGYLEAWESRVSSGLWALKVSEVTWACPDPQAYQAQETWIWMGT